MNGTALLVQLVGGIALLLWGVRMVRTGMTRAFGANLRRVLAVGMQNRLSAFACGFGITTLLQSSTATAMIVSSFAARALVVGSVAFAIMLGADVGSAVVAQIFSVRAEWLAPLLIAAGTFAFLAAKGERPRHVARIFIGIGLMFLALRLIGEAAAPLRDSPAFGVVVRALASEPILALLVAALLTWLAHSSLAVVLFVMTLTAMNGIEVAAALALVLGANLGGALAPLLDQAGASPAARRVPLGNLVMRAAGALVLLPWLDPAAALLARIEADPARLVVNGHVAFNLLVAAIFLPLVPAIDALTKRLLPDRPEAEDAGRPRYLDAAAIEHPPEALACAARETLNLGDRVAEMLRLAMVVFERDDAKLRREVELADNVIDRLHEAIKLYLIQVSRSGLDESESRRHVDILTFTTNLEHVGDIIDKNLMELAAKKIRNRLTFSAEGQGELRAFHARVAENMKLAFNVFMSRDEKLARRLLAEKSALREAEFATADKHFARLREGRPESIETSAIHLDIVRDLKRINSHLTSVAYPILEEAGALRQSRLVEEGETVAANGNGVPANGRKPQPS
jgi:phosphate:Na+ symporter